MIDLLTIGGFAAVIIFVCAACFGFYKLLSRDDKFDEVYPNDALKLLISNKENVNNKNKTKNKRHHHPKRPKVEPANNGEQKEIVNGVNDNEQKVEEQADTPILTKPRLNVETGNNKKHEQNKNNKKSKGQSPAKRQRKIEEIKIEEDVKQKTVESLNAANNEEGIEEVNVNVKNGNNKGIGQAVENGTMSHQTLLQEPKKFRKTVLTKELTLQKVVERLKEIGDIEPEYLNYLQTMTEETNSKENKLHAEVKEINAEKMELEKEKKQMVEELDKFKAHNEQLAKENKEQKVRHVEFEQIVREKLVETHQLKKQNKNLTESMVQLNGKAAQQFKEMQQKIEGIQAEAFKAQEERNLANNYAEKLTAEIRKEQEEMRGIQINFDRQNQAIQAELNKERENRIKIEQDFNMARQTVDQLRATYEAKLKDLQNELNREKEESKTWKNVGNNAEPHIAEMSSELEKAMAAYQNLKSQQGTDNGKLSKLMAMNQKLEEELTKEKTISQQTMSQNTKEIDELKSSIADQRRRNDDLRQTNFKLHETIEKMQKESEKRAQFAVNGINGKQENEPTVSKGEDELHVKQIERLTAENKQYKNSLDNLNKQLEEVSQIARDMEREKDEKIAQIEAKLTNLLKHES